MAISALFIELITAGAAVGGSAAGGMAAWYSVHRKTSGRIGTSDADVLWQQNSAMRESLLSQLDKVTEQRDRIIDSQASQVLPLMSGMTEMLTELSDAIHVIIQHEEAEKTRDELIAGHISDNQAKLALILERLSRHEVLEIQGTAQIASGTAGPDGIAAQP